VELLAGDQSAAESALRDGYDALGHLGELGIRSSVAAMLARTLHARGEAAEADELAGEVEATASEQDLWSQTLYRLARARLLADGGAHDEAERVARDALAIVEPTDLLDLRGDVLLELASVLRSARRLDAARECVERGIGLYQAKGNIVAVKRARAHLELVFTKA
jgi:tetratricopeptide (TPR) repeat protein